MAAHGEKGAYFVKIMKKYCKLVLIFVLCRGIIMDAELRLITEQKIRADGHTERWLSWSKAHDWKSCVRLITDRGFESHSLRQKKASQCDAFFNEAHRAVHEK